MSYLKLVAASSLLLSSAALSQAPSPPPAVTGCSHCALPPSMGPQDRASDPNSIERMREGLQKDRVDKLSSEARMQLGRSRPAKAAEVVAGKPVNDSTGQLIALIEKVEPDGAILYNGAANVKVPVEAFGVNRKGLLLDMTKDKFDALVAQASSPTKS